MGEGGGVGVGGGSVGLRAEGEANRVVVGVVGDGVAKLVVVSGEGEGCGGKGGGDLKKEPTMLNSWSVYWTVGLKMVL